MNKNFKTRFFGGFDRQDVISFIEKTTQENNDRISALEMENTALKNRLDELQTELETKQQAYVCECNENKELQSKILNLDEKNKSLEAETEEFQKIKNHIAEIEINAHQRTEQFRKEAITQLREIIASQDAWCAQAKKDCIMLKESIAERLREAEDLVTEIDAGCLDEMSCRLNELSASFDETEKDTSRTEEVPAKEPVVEAFDEPEIAIEEEAVLDEETATDEETVTEKIAAVVEEATAEKPFRRDQN